MRTEQVLDIVKNRGLKIALKDGRPVIVPGPNRKEVTDELVKVLTIHRDRIIALLSAPNP